MRAGEPASAASHAPAFGVFAFAWALSGLLDVVSYAEWDRSPAHALYVAASLAVLLRPGSVALFAAHNALRLAVFWVESPQTANHHVLNAVVALTLLAGLGVEVVRTRGRPQPTAWRERCAPALRAQLLCVYGFAVLHKLNRDYLDPEVSCAVHLPREVLPSGWGEALAALPGGGALMIAGSLALEAAVPLLLARRGTRGLGLALGVFFHGFLGIRFQAFSTGLFALYTLFLSDAHLEAAVGAARARVRRWAPAAFALGLGAATAGLAVALRSGQFAPRLTTAGFAALALCWLAAVLAAASFSLRAPAARARLADPPPGRLSRHPGLAAWTLLVLLNGFSPYLGLRTVPTFSMFSNLRTEGGLSNHLFMPARALRVADYQEDLVMVLDAEDPELRRFARQPRRTFHDLRVAVQESTRGRGGRGVGLRYRRGGRQVTLERAEDDAELMRPLAWWERKWLAFRPIPVRPKRGCTW